MTQNLTNEETSLVTSLSELMELGRERVEEEIRDRMEAERKVQWEQEAAALDFCKFEYDLKRAVLYGADKDPENFSDEALKHGTGWFDSYKPFSCKIMTLRKRARF